MRTYSASHRRFSLRNAVSVVAASATVVMGLSGLPSAGVSAASGGTLEFARIEGYWIQAGGPRTEAATAAAIVGAESSSKPGNIQQNQAYSMTGWGLWQITPGNSEAQFCVDFRLLDPWNNAEAAVAKYRGSGNSFSPWTTYRSGAYRDHLPANPPTPILASDPGEYVQIGTAPAGTHNGAQPGSTCGPALAAPAYAFWQGTNGDLYEAQGTDDATMDGPFDRGMGPMGSPPAVATYEGITYVYWKGTDGDLYESYWDIINKVWVHQIDQGMGAMGSAPSVAIDGSGRALVFWKGTNGDLYEAQGSLTGQLNGPFDRVTAQLGSAPSVGVDGAGTSYVYWKGTDDGLWETFWNVSNQNWVAPFKQAGMGPLGSAPSATVDDSGRAMVFWKGTNGGLFEAQGSATGQLNGPFNRGMGPLGSAPSATLDTGGASYVYWKGTNDELYECYWDGNNWIGPKLIQGMGPLGSAPSATVSN